MALPANTLRIVLNEGRFIADTATPDAPLSIAPFTFGDVIPLRLEAYLRAQSDASQFTAVDISSFTIEAMIGDANQRPALGFWTLTFGADTFGPFAAEAKAWQDQQRLNAYDS